MGRACENIRRDGLAIALCRGQQKMPDSRPMSVNPAVFMISRAVSLAFLPIRRSVPLPMKSVACSAVR